MQPGRSCPLHYQYSPQVFARAPDIQAETLYVIGGLYGNVPALEAIQALAAQEPAPATLAFNGDFNWFNIDDKGFRTINREVLRHYALRGNVETEIAGEDEGAGCGCAYPDSVSEAEVERSNAILSRLRNTARRHPDMRARFAGLPMHLVAQVGTLRVGIVHGDLESLAGWSLSQDRLAEPDIINIVKKHILTSICHVVASSHTCLPVAVSLDTAAGRCAIFNNGAAGMPNFHRLHFGVVTRIATSASPHPPLYGTRIGNVYIDALPVHYDHARWQRDFLANWPSGSAAHLSYHQRITDGPAYAAASADRLTVIDSSSARPSAMA